MPMAKGVTSGELWYRAFLQGKGQQDGEESWVGPQLQQFLSSSCNSESCRLRFGESLERLSEAKAISQAQRQSRQDVVKRGSGSLNGSADVLSKRCSVAAMAYDCGVQWLQRVLAEYLSALSVYYFSIGQREWELFQKRTDTESRTCEELQEEAEISFNLKVFALHLANESSGQIMLKRLPAAQ